MRGIQKTPDKQSGNVLFLILIAVALFAALSYAVTQGGRGGNNMLKEEKYMSSARLTEIGATMQSAALRMVLSKTPIDSILLHDQVGPDKTLPCTSGDTCLFAMEGGGVTFPRLPRHLEKGGALFPPTIYLYEIADGAKVTGLAGGQAVLLLQIRYINKEICTNLNRGLNISGMPEQFLASVTSGQMTGAPGKSEACVKTTAAEDYTYYHVLAVP